MRLIKTYTSLTMTEQVVSNCVTRVLFRIDVFVEGINIYLITVSRW